MKPAQISRFAALSALTLAATLAACSSSDGSDPGEGVGEDERAPIGKADSTGSCAEPNVCGKKSSGNCYCDSKCKQNGDCCADYGSACLGEPEPSEGCSDDGDCGDGRRCVAPQCLPGGPCPSGACVVVDGRCESSDACDDGLQCAKNACAAGPDCAAGYCEKPATLKFAGDYSETQSGTLYPGVTIKVEYDANRLTQCRGDYMGKPGWSIYGYYRINGGQKKSFHVAGFSSTGQPPKPEFVADSAGKLEMWFENTSRWGCIGYDSNMNDNYRFTLAQPGSG